ncbi:restriction endonuclease [Aeromicrobium erythreum]|uniref:site-specific DNA-methyltransferase (adenine-specific) n=2 Tax=Aeromicrobium erythreum TaxID=2041 RepID=A0A0U4B807_9ACTN|nr:restriction endonuclease [Aeromicrobium erythreum]
MVDAAMRALGYYDDEDAIVVEKQQSVVKAIREALSKASKTGKGRAGYPEFIVTSPDTPDIVVLVECKADTAKHESANRDKPVDFAVDGVLHYARFLSPRYTVIAIAVSGTRSSNLWSFFLMPKGETQPKVLVAPSGAEVDSLIPMDDLIRAASFDPMVHQRRERDLILFSQQMHEFMRNEAEMSEQEKPLAVAGTLIALSNDVFARTYDAYPARDLPDFWMRTIKDEVSKAKIPVSKVNNMTQPFTAIEVQPELSKSTHAYPKGLLSEIVRLLADRVLPFMTVYHDYDVVGRFYGEFLKYSGGDGKLGIVLTPKHVAELFALIANVNKNSVVVDPCAGTGSFLISAMMQMTKTATTEAEITSIKKDRLIGIEQRPSMYALAVSNMILRGDGKANLYQGSCFDTPNINAVKKHKDSSGRILRPNVGLINPPYAKSKADLSELRFVDNMLDMLEKGGTGVAIVPVSCATAASVEKQTILNKHTLEAVMSMPPELFTPVGAIACIMVFTAGVPHNVANKKSWFGYWREDGFVKIKNLGRVDRHHTWPGIRDRWISSWRNREVHPGESVTATVTAKDEWVAEAFMETDYSNLSQRDLERVLLDHALFVLKGSQPAETADDD